MHGYPSVQRGGIKEDSEKRFFKVLVRGCVERWYMIECFQSTLSKVITNYASWILRVWCESLHILAHVPLTSGATSRLHTFRRALVKQLLSSHGKNSEGIIHTGETKPLCCSLGRIHEVKAFNILVEIVSTCYQDLKRPLLIQRPTL